jgi:hypothetical protein
MRKKSHYTRKKVFDPVIRIQDFIVRPARLCDRPWNFKQNRRGCPAQLGVGSDGVNFTWGTNYRERFALLSQEGSTVAFFATVRGEVP